MNALDNYLNSPFLKSKKTALLFFSAKKNSNQKVSFRELYLLVIKAQNFLDQTGHKRGDSLLLFQKPGPELYALIMGAMGMGIKLIFIEPWMPNSKVNQIIIKTRPKSIITNFLGEILLKKSKEVRKISQFFNAKTIHKNYRKRQNQAHSDFSHTKKEVECLSMSNDDLAILTYTSGTSSFPKGAHRSHKLLLDQACVLKKHLNYNLSLENEALDLTIFPNMVLLNLALGKGSLLFGTPWRKRYFKLLDAFVTSLNLNIDTAAIGPHFLENLLLYTKAIEFKSLRVGGALADITLLERTFKRWPGADIKIVYGSTEAEPVILGDGKKMIDESKKKNFYQLCALGEKIDDIKIELESSKTWVSGPHVSPLYTGDEKANRKFKKVDTSGVVWHNMGDRLSRENNIFFYAGRNFQKESHFKLEQYVYKHLGHSGAFITEKEGKTLLICQYAMKNKKNFLKRFKDIDFIVSNAKIYRDIRHRSRIDREKSYKKIRWRIKWIKILSSLLKKEFP